MDNQLEIAAVKANCFTVEGVELSWLFSRTQLEFVLKDVEILTSSPFIAKVQYGSAMLPVITLESYYGLENRESKTSAKYLVMRTVVQSELVKLIIETPKQVKIFTVNSSFSAINSLSLPQNEGDVLGFYLMPDGTVGAMPNIAKIYRSLE